MFSSESHSLGSAGAATQSLSAASIRDNKRRRFETHPGHAGLFVCLLGAAGGERGLETREGGGGGEYNGRGRSEGGGGGSYLKKLLT